MSELKLQKLLQVNEKLRADELLPRIKVSEASKNLVAYVKSHPDAFVNPNLPEFKTNPYIQAKSGGCTIL